MKVFFVLGVAQGESTGSPSAIPALWFPDPLVRSGCRISRLNQQLLPLSHLHIQAYSWLLDTISQNLFSLCHKRNAINSLWHEMSPYIRLFSLILQPIPVIVKQKQVLIAGKSVPQKWKVRLRIQRIIVFGKGPSRVLPKSTVRRISVSILGLQQVNCLS